MVNLPSRRWSSFLSTRCTVNRNTLSARIKLLCINTHQLLNFKVSIILLHDMCDTRFDTDRLWGCEIPKLSEKIMVINTLYKYHKNKNPLLLLTTLQSIFERLLMEHLLTIRICHTPSSTFQNLDMELNHLKTSDVQAYMVAQRVFVPIIPNQYL